MNEALTRILGLKAHMGIHKKASACPKGEERSRGMSTSFRLSESVWNQGGFAYNIERVIRNCKGDWPVYRLKTLVK